MNTLSLKIIACDRVFYDGPCEILKFPGYDGQMAILAHHEKMTTNIEVGELHFRTPDGEEHVAICSDGLLKVKNNEVVVLVGGNRRVPCTGCEGTCHRADAAETEYHGIPRIPCFACESNGETAGT